VPTSSLGRLFDAVAALAGVCQRVTYEGQAAIELEALVDADARLGDAQAGYAFDIGEHQVEAAPVIAALVADLRAGKPANLLAARFHAAVARMLVEVCCRLRGQTGLDQVALSGGVWQNAWLLRLTSHRLQAAGFTVHAHRQVPSNDGGLALGQAAIAAAWLSQPHWTPAAQLGV
jgi:hydrogenase maturation protein HypF